MKALVTGGGGFIGQHLVDALSRDPRFAEVVRVVRTPWCKGPLRRKAGPSGSVVTDYGCDLRNPKAVAILMERFAPKVVFHLAANPLTKPSDEDPGQHAQVDLNVCGTQNLLAACPDGCRFVYASSATVYGDTGTDLGSPAREWWPTAPTSVYAATKVAGEALVEAHTRLGRVRGVSLRYVANVGPLATHGVLLDLMRKLAGPSECLELLGDAPGSCKPYMHVSDTVVATVFAAFLGKNGVFNVSADDSLSVEDLAATMMAAVGKEKPVRWAGEAANWRGDNPLVLVSNAKLGNCGWRPATPRSADAVARAAKELGAFL